MHIFITGIEAKVCQDIAERQRKGIKKYGVSLEDNKLSELEINQHLYEELLDAAAYMKKKIEMLKSK